MDKLVITYRNADLDCLASAYAYAEFLKKLGEDAGYFIIGNMLKEVDIVCSMFNIELDRSKMNTDGKQIVVVDTNIIDEADSVLPEQVVEVIDHHPKSGDVFENAIVDIQPIGAVCTMIAERYKDNNIEISRESAILLYYGIILNTVNFNAKITNERDKKMALWLKDQCTEISDKYIRTIFEEKSKFDIKDLRNVMEVEKKFILGNDILIIGQLEITDARDFVKKHSEDMKEIMEHVKNDYGISLVFVNIIDTLEGYHMLFAPDKNMQDFLEQRLNIKFNNGIYEENKVVLRKEIKKQLNDSENANSKI